MKARPAAATLAAALALGCSRELPPLGEAVVIVDTDLPAPGIVDRLRVDLYTADRSAWYVSREIATPDPSAWPVSFSVYDPDPSVARAVVLRLRAYPGGVVRDYRGERFTPRPGERRRRPRPRPSPPSPPARRRGSSTRAAPT